MGVSGMNSAFAYDVSSRHAISRAAALSPIVIRLGALGDMINLTALLHLLHLRYGRPCIVVGAGPWSEPVYRGNPDVAQVWTLDRHLPLLLDPSVWQLLVQLRCSDPAPIYVCDDDKRLPRVRRLLTLSGVDPERVATIGPELAGTAEHHIERLIRFGRTTPPALQPDEFPTPLLQRTCPRAPCRLEGERAQLRGWMAMRGLAHRPLILVQVGNRRTNGTRRARHRRLNRDDKCWPARRWIELLRRLHERMPSAVLMLCGAPGEARMLHQLEAELALPGSIVVAALPLRPFFALCQLAHSMISVDTGPAHAAAALGLPLVVLFGAQSQSRWLPRGPPGTRVIGLGGPPVSAHVAEISVEQTFSAWCALVAQPEPRQCRNTMAGSPDGSQRASESISAAYAGNAAVASPATLP
jgi:heptosyltransferase-2/heptosyltransferase-3